MIIYLSVMVRKIIFFRILSFLTLLYIPLGLAAEESIKTLLVVGDSLSAGYGFDPKQGWVSLLNERIQKQGLPYRVINMSVSGNTTSNGVTSLPAALKEYKPTWVIIGLGSNDGLRGLSTVEMKKNLNQMIEVSKAANAKVLLVGFLIPVNYGPVYRKQFEAVFQEVATRYQIPQVPFLLKDVALNPDLMQDDGLHPNAKAQPKLVETVWPYLKKMGF